MKTNFASIVTRAVFLVAATLLVACTNDAPRSGNDSPPATGQAPQIASFTASSTSIAAGQSVTLSWSVSGAASLGIDPGYASVTGTSLTVTPASTTTYTLRAVSDGGQSSTRSLTVTVNAPPPALPPQIVSFTISHPTISTGQSTTLSWNVVGATALRIAPGHDNVTGTSLTVSPADTTTYTLTATNANGSSTAQVTVTVTAGGTGRIYDASILASESTLSDADWALLTQSRFFFGHQSVGSNIMSGFAALDDTDPHFAIRDQWPYALLADIPGAYFFNQGVGENYDPASKIADFDYQIRTDPAAGNQVQVAWFKFCYVDFSSTTNVDELANAYIAEMNALERDFPGTRFLWTTAPLTASADSVNVIRNQYAQRIRDYALANGKSVYDVAALEAVAASGQRCTFTVDGAPYDRLCADWWVAENNPHLNGDGGKRLARALGLALIDMLKQ